MQHVQDVEAEEKVEYAKIGSNKNADLKSPEEINNLEEGEMHHSQDNVDILEASSDLLFGAVSLELLKEDEFLHPNIPSPTGAKSSPSYADMAKKKKIDSSGSSSDDSIDKLSKNTGRKSKKEAREEEAERLKMQGIQSTIEMSYGRSKRTRPLKGATTPSHPSK